MVTGPHDAIAILLTDHKHVKSLFHQLDQLGDRSKVNKKKLANQICHELMIHSQIEEELFYPAVRGPLKDDDLMDKALVEHASVTKLIEQIKYMNPEDDLFDARLKVLAEQIERHIDEEEHKLFPKVRKTKVDLLALGEQMAGLKADKAENPMLSTLFSS